MIAGKVKIVSDSFAHAVREVDRLRALNADLLAALKASRIYVQDCIENGHDKTMLANLYGARDEIDAALAGKAASSPTSGVTQAARSDAHTPPSDIREALNKWLEQLPIRLPDNDVWRLHNMVAAALTSSPPGDGKLREALEKKDG